MALSVTEWLTSNPDYLIDTVWDGVDAGTYFRTPKPDGGYEFYLVRPDGSVGITSAQDTFVATKIPMESLLGQDVAGATQEGTTVNVDGSAGTGPTQAQLDAALETYNSRSKQIQTARKEGLMDVDDAEFMIQQNRDQIKKDLGSGYEANQSYFSQASPNVYQSQQGAYDNKVLDAYNTSSKTLDRNQNRIAGARESVESQYNADRSELGQSYLDYKLSGTPGSGGYSYNVPAEYTGAGLNTLESVDPVSAYNQSAKAASGSVKPSFGGLAGGAIGSYFGPVGSAIGGAIGSGADALTDYLKDK